MMTGKLVFWCFLWLFLIMIDIPIHSTPFPCNCHKSWGGHTLSSWNSCYTWRSSQFLIDKCVPSILAPSKHPVMMAVLSLLGVEYTICTPYKSSFPKTLHCPKVFSIFGYCFPGYRFLLRLNNWEFHKPMQVQWQVFPVSKILPF